ncbi:MAG TPA: DUF1573 domain-containing protein, partial [Bacteroidia bacterium]|nr:DUF1573 domain-containing protein [Bacteroidia bacterium]
VSSSPTLQDKYSKRSGSLRFSATTLNLGRLAGNETRKDTILIFNTASRPVTIAADSKMPACIELSIGHASIEPGTESWIAISYNAVVKNDFGFVLDRILLTTNDSIQPQKYINISATIHEYFPPLNTDDSALVQRARIPELNFNYGTLVQGEKVSHDFKIFNDGTRDLLIHKAKSNCGCIHTTLSKQVIAAGDSAFVRVDFDSFGKEGKDNRTIDLYLNDPARPEVKLEIAGEIRK